MRNFHRVAPHLFSYININDDSRGQTSSRLQKSNNLYTRNVRMLPTIIEVMDTERKMTKMEKIISGQLSGMPGSKSISARRQKPLKIISK